MLRPRSREGLHGLGGGGWAAGEGERGDDRGGEKAPDVTGNEGMMKGGNTSSERREVVRQRGCGSSWRWWTLRMRGHRRVF